MKINRNGEERTINRMEQAMAGDVFSVNDGHPRRMVYLGINSKCDYILIGRNSPDEVVQRAVRGYLPSKDALYTTKFTDKKVPKSRGAEYNLINLVLESRKI